MKSSRMTKTKATLNVTVPPELVIWLDQAVKKRVFANRSHGVELCILEGKRKYG
jgi:metal-responsive CopG/Arc/MetJ family transcriptional regulator